tara:strand:+ start:144 stop:1490 length:1347 start_codon:yes stop_codon:yes gene_type:complete
LPTPSNITGTIVDATGTPVQYVVIRLSPAPYDSGGQVREATGVVMQPVETETDVNGDFTIGALQGFRYRLTIEAIGLEEVFVMPAAATAFHLLGLIPVIASAANSTDADDNPVVYLSVEAVRIRTARERYTKLKVESATSLGGAYTDVTTFDLLDGVSFYDYTDTPATADVFYRARYEDATATEVSPWSDVVSAAATEREELVISPEEMETLYLFGASLQDDDGNPFPRSMFLHYIKAATQELERALDFTITPTDIVDEAHDHYAKDYGRWGYFQLQQYPVISVETVFFQYPSMEEGVQIASDWIVTLEDGDSGVISIVPGRGSIADVLLIPGALMPLWSGASGRVPGIWKMTYRAGFEEGEIPDDIKHYIAMGASIGILNIAGDLIAGAGIATKSISIPGLSQNIGTTSSATNSGYGARIIEYQKERKEMLPLFKQTYGKTLKMVVV